MSDNKVMSPLVESILNATVVQKDKKEFQAAALNLMFLSRYMPVNSKENMNQPFDLVTGLGKLALAPAPYQVPAKNAVDNLFAMLDVCDHYKDDAIHIASEVIGNIRHIGKTGTEPTTLKAISENIADYGARKDANEDHLWDLKLIAADMCAKVSGTKTPQDQTVSMLYL